jgi:hypothetical protein
MSKCRGSSGRCPLPNTATSPRSSLRKSRKPCGGVWQRTELQARQNRRAATGNMYSEPIPNEIAAERNNCALCGQVILDQMTWVSSIGGNTKAVLDVSLPLACTCLSRPNLSTGEIYCFYRYIVIRVRVIPTIVVPVIVGEIILRCFLKEDSSQCPSRSLQSVVRIVSTPAHTPALVTTSPPSPSPRGEPIKETPPTIAHGEAVADVAQLRFVDNPCPSAEEVAAAVLFQIQPQAQDLP